jgi:hypothetical protein
MIDIFKKPVLSLPDSYEKSLVLHTFFGFNMHILTYEMGASFGMG